MVPAGGFTGGGSAYLLYANGRAEFHWRQTYRSNDSLLATNLADTAKLGEFRIRLLTAREKTPHGLNRANSGIVKHLTYTERDSSIVWTWGSAADLVDASPELEILYDELRAYGEALFPNPFK